MVSTSATFASTVTYVTGLTGTSQALPSRSGITTYYWQVFDVATGGTTGPGGTSDWADAWTFTTASPPREYRHSHLRHPARQPGDIRIDPELVIERRRAVDFLPGSSVVDQRQLRFNGIGRDRDNRDLAGAAHYSRQ